MKCVLCNGITTKKNVDHKEFGTLIGTYPAEVCQKCGETYFDEKTTGTIQQRSKKLGLFGLARKVTVGEIGNSIAIRIPKELSEFIGLKKGKEVTLVPETKHEIRIYA